MVSRSLSRHPTEYCPTVPKKVKGKFHGELRVYGSHAIFTIFVIDKSECGCILSKTASEKLGLLKFNPRVKNEVANSTSSLKKIGKLKGIQVKLHIDESISPVAQPHRRIPYHFRKAVEKKIKELEAQDIIKKVDGPTPWVSPVVVFPRPDPKDPVRMCIDMRCANKAIPRERHIMPTIDDILSGVQGAKWFAKRDLNSAYHQVEFARESRYITTFSTHLGLRRYKRLFYGISSASEIFHILIGEILSDHKEVIHTMDDILIFAEAENRLRERTRLVDKRLEETASTK